MYFYLNKKNGPLRFYCRIKTGRNAFILIINLMIFGRKFDLEKFRSQTENILSAGLKCHLGKEIFLKALNLYAI